MTRIISESLERKLGWRERTILRLHLFVCLYCLRYLQQLLFIHQSSGRAYASKTVYDSAPGLSLEARERIGLRLKDRGRSDK